MLLKRAATPTVYNHNEQSQNTGYHKPTHGTEAQSMAVRAVNGHKKERLHTSAILKSAATEHSTIAS